MFNIDCYQRNGNQNYNEIKAHTGQNGQKKKKNPQTTNDGEGMERREPSCTVGRNGNWYSHYREQYGGSLKN